MTAQELFECVKLWPEGARANGLRYIGQPDPTKPDYPDCWAAVLSANITSCVHTHHAVALHVASGLEWLLQQSREVDLNILNDGGYLLFYRDMESVQGPTLFHAIHAAILATGASK